MNTVCNLTCYEGKTILVTGATGLIGRTVVYNLLKWNQKASKPIQVIAFIRDKIKAEQVFASYLCPHLRFITADIHGLEIVDMGIDYIIHGASQTASKAFMEEPVETIMTAVMGTKNMLELARINKVAGFIYLSSMEVYGNPTTDEKIDEEYVTNLNTMHVRTCYPESKRMCENLCASYASEYGVPAKVIRLTQTFGPGVEYNDGRIFAEFARCVIEGRDIMLNTKGKTKRNYLYTEDAVRAILKVLKEGCVGEAYNAANENTYCTIYEMACMVKNICADHKINVIIREDVDISNFGYAPTLKMNLDTRKLKGLGWEANVELKEMFVRMIEDMKKAHRGYFS